MTMDTRSDRPEWDAHDDAWFRNSAQFRGEPHIPGPGVMGPGTDEVGVGTATPPCCVDEVRLTRGVARYGDSTVEDTVVTVKEEHVTTVPDVLNNPRRALDVTPRSRWPYRWISAMFDRKKPTAPFREICLD